MIIRRWVNLIVMLNGKSMFGEDFKYVLVLTLLAWMTYTLPSVRAAFQDAATTETSSDVAALVESSSNLAAAYSSMEASRGSSNVKFPPGYTCTPNPVAPGGVTASVDGRSKLDLAYDKDKKEALLTATFKVTVDGGKNGVYLTDMVSVSFKNQNGMYVGANSMRSQALKPISKVTGQTNSYGETVYFVPAGKKLQFQEVATVDPKQLLAGTYYASLDVLIGYTALNNGIGFKIPVDTNQTNSKTIIGEVSPYIVSATNPIKNGEKMVISGQRLNDTSANSFGQVFIDGVPLVGASVDGTKDGTALFFVLPAMTEGYHWLSVQTNMGMSNTASFEVLVPVMPPVINPSCPVGYTCIPVATTTPQVSGCPSGFTCTPVLPVTGTCYNFTSNLTLGSVGNDVAALQTLLITRGFNIPSIANGTVAKGTFDEETRAALMQFQISVGIPSTGFAGPVTIAALNSLCGSTVVTTPIL